MLGKALHSLDLDPESTVILGLVRGGAVIAAHAAESCSLIWDIFIVRKIGSPDQPEYAVGAVCENGQYTMNRNALEYLGLDDTWVNQAVHKASQECSVLNSQLRKTTVPLHLRARQVVLVDDGMATGLTMRTAVEGVLAAGASRVIVGVPVLSTDALAALDELKVESCYLAVPPEFRAVGQYYADFSPVTTDEVNRLLAGRSGLDL